MYRETVADQLYLELREEILRGIRRPGDRINELTVARRASVSQGPVREALAALRAEGLLKASTNKGSFVTPTFIEDAGTAYEVRQRLEPLAAARMCEVASEDDIAELRACSDAIKGHEPDTDITTLVNDDLKFHGTIYLHSKSVVLLQMWKVLEMMMRRYFSLHFAPATLAEQKALDQGAAHEEIYEAIARRDAGTAAQLAEQHVQGSWHLTAFGIERNDGEVRLS